MKKQVQIEVTLCDDCEKDLTTSMGRSLCGLCKKERCSKCTEKATVRFGPEKYGCYSDLYLCHGCLFNCPKTFWPVLEIFLEFAILAEQYQKWEAIQHQFLKFHRDEIEKIKTKGKKLWKFDR
jgi:hypothetical protein